MILTDLIFFFIFLGLAAILNIISVVSSFGTKTRVHTELVSVVLIGTSIAFLVHALFVGVCQLIVTGAGVA